MISRPLILAALLEAASLLLCKAESPSSRVTVLVTDNYGRPLPTAQIRVRGSEATYDVKEGVEIDLKPGSYDLTAHVPGFVIYSRTVTIDQPSQVLSIAMRLDGYDGHVPRVSVRGRIDPAEHDVRVRLMSLAGTEIKDVPVTKNGSFELQGLEGGAYMFLALRGTQCLGATIASVTAERVRVRIPLSKPVGTNCVPAQSDQKKE
jgi:hypothetical protein